ncbi:hypothetical protein JRQ81_005275 [Phrynocephalus forsythii]|uniref:Uncharacterized protein n=1 Tax=Phrynocephalus forsythii TaxID=171643 RepID=A0A9Q1B6L5_9SAUR|nr:hypothetical protein JRQ81_005275 [Phrynocephalus forsythii]
MKGLHVLLLVAFLVFQAESNPKPPAEEDVKGNKKGINDPEPAALQADEEGLKEEEDEHFRAIRQSCFGGNGYCLPRQYYCASGLVFKEQYNSCGDKRRNKCCVGGRLG